MRIGIRQVYISPGINFPFSHLFQKWVSQELTGIVQPSGDFIRKYGDDFTLVFNLSAKAEIQKVEIRGPSIFRKTKDVEYTIFLPYDTIHKSSDVIASALSHLFAGIIDVLELLKIDAREVSRRVRTMVEYVCSDPSMIKKSNQTGQI